MTAKEPFEAGAHAPDAPLLNVQGRIEMLSTAWRERPAVIAFLRYFGCPLCRQQVAMLRRDRERFEQGGVQVVLVGQGKPEDAREFAESQGVPFPLLVDPTRAAYQAYGLIRGSLLKVFAPQCVVPMVRAAVDPETHQGLLHGGDLLQMPGTFVVDTDGIVRLAHRNETIVDNPGTDELLRVTATIRRAA